MAAIITEKFRQHNADQFFESFSEASASTYYIFVGKATAFTSGTTGGSDSSPPTPSDSPTDTEFYAWDSMLAAKNVTSSDINSGRPLIISLTSISDSWFESPNLFPALINSLESRKNHAGPLPDNAVITGKYCSENSFVLPR